MSSIFKGITGPWGVLALLVMLTPSGRKFARTAAKEAVKVGIIATEKVKEIASELQEEGSDMIAELKDERTRELGGNGAKDKSNLSRKRDVGLEA